MLIHKRLLKIGSKGGDVKELQAALLQLDFNPNGVDGVFGKGTDLALRQFQNKHNLEVDGVFGPASARFINNLLSSGTQSLVKKPAAGASSRYYKIGSAYIIETPANNIEISILGSTLHRAGRYGINGSFFDTPKPGLAASAWSIATNNGKPVGGNSMLVSYTSSIKRGTIVSYKDGSVGVLRVNNINQFPKAHNWSISGYSVYPYLNFAAEKMPSGINYKTAHTYIGYKGSQIYLIVKPNHMIREILPLIRQLGLQGCIVLDGGGSSQLRHPNGNYQSGRAINTAVILKEV